MVIRMQRIEYRLRLVLPYSIHRLQILNTRFPHGPDRPEMIEQFFWNASPTPGIPSSAERSAPFLRF
jgi:hypothetical protein